MAKDERGKVFRECAVDDEKLLDVRRSEVGCGVVPSIFSS